MTSELVPGNVLSRIFATYGDQAGVLLPVAAAVYAVQVVIAVLLASAGGLLVLLAIPIQLVFSTLYSGMVVELVSDVQDGRRDHTVGSLFRAVGGVVVPLILAGLVTGLLIGLGFILLIVPGLILATIFSVVAPAIVIERKGVFEAMGRSRELVRDNGLKVFLVILVVFLLSIVLGFVARAAAGDGEAVGLIVNFVVTTLLAPVSALAAGVLYFELRRAKGEEGPAPAAPGPDAAGPAVPQ